MNDERTLESDETEADAAADTTGEGSTDRATDPVTAARVDAWLLGAGATDREPARDGADPARRRRLLLGSAAVVAAAVAVGGVIAATNGSSDDASSAASTTRASTVGAAGSTAATTSVVTTTAGSTSVATTGTATTVATTAAATTTVPATTAPATTVPAGPAALTDGQLYQALVDGTYATGQAVPHGLLTGGGTAIVVSGFVPDAATRAKVLAVFDPSPNKATVIDSLTIDAAVPAPAAVLLTIEGFDTSNMFREGSPELAISEGAGFSQSETLIALWAKRLVEVPSARMFAVVRRDDEPGTLATSRANAIRLRFQGYDARLENTNQFLPVITGSPSTGPQVAFAQLVAP